MEKYKESIKKRTIWMSCLIVGLVVVYIICVILRNRFPFVDQEVADMYLGFQAGLSVSIGFALAIGIWKIRRALKSEEKLRMLYIEEHDERKNAIAFRAAASGVLVIMIILIAATFITAYINKTVFLTLITVTACISVILLVLKIYYNKKL